MRIVVVGDKQQQDEFVKKFGSQHQYTLSENHPVNKAALQSAELIFDFSIDETPENIEYYQGSQAVVLVNVVKTGLAELQYAIGEITFIMVGFNGLPTFINRPTVEISTLATEHKAKVEILLQQAGTDFLWVEDRVGMASPRVICMIINEAFYTVQEGTASKEDIDQGMKLGTSYPYGPFEWCNKIGIQHVYEVLEALYEDTREERYKICPLLKKEYLLRA